MIDAFKPVRDLEAALCEYTGAPYAVVVNSCSMALLLACAWHNRHVFDGVGEPIIGGRFTRDVQIPKRTYISVPMAIVHAGFGVTFRDQEWNGFYELSPLKVFDCARWFTSGMFNGMPVLLGRPMTHPERTNGLRYLCVSFHHSKVLGDTQGGAILHNDLEADAWLRRARFDGRTEGLAPKDDTFTQIGWHCYMSPDVATRLLWKMTKLPKHNDPLPNDDYPDLSTMEIFK